MTAKYRTTRGISRSQREDSSPNDRLGGKYCYTGQVHSTTHAGAEATGFYDQTASEEASGSVWSRFVLDLEAVRGFFSNCDPDHIWKRCRRVRSGGIWSLPCVSETVDGLFRQHGEARQGNLQVINSDKRLRLVSDSEAHLRSIIATLEDNRAALVESSNPEAAQILAIAILQLRMQLHGIDGSDLKAFCQVLQRQDAERVRVKDCCR